MSAHKTNAHQLDSTLARQVLTLPAHTRFLLVELDRRFNGKVLLHTLENTKEGIKTEKVEFVMVRLYQELEPVNAKYVSSLNDNSGILHIFALRESELVVGQAIGAEDKK